jgi:hypothetical protein
VFIADEKDILKKVKNLEGRDESYGSIVSEFILDTEHTTAANPNEDFYAN